MSAAEMRRVARAVPIAVVIVACAVSVLAQGGTTADVAAKISGTWKLNLELSPTLTAPGRFGGRGRSRGGGPSLAMGPTAPQRRGRGGEGGSEAGGESGAPVPPEELAGQKVLRVFEQVPTDVTIAATVGTVSVQEPSGQGTFTIDGKTAVMEIAGSKIKVKSKWDRAVLKQEFSTSRRKVTRSWGLDPASHLILTTRVESLGMNAVETLAVFDRQP